MSSTSSDSAPSPPPERQVRALFTDAWVRVYQAYAPRIAEPAIQAQRFVPPFKLTRTTWIKPSFLWMMYRSGWGRKPDQEQILAIDVRREAFDLVLSNAVATHFDRGEYATREAWQNALQASDVLVQWDPERNWQLAALPHRAIQLGLRGEAARAYASEWIVAIHDVTPLVRDVEAAVRAGDEARAHAIRPVEAPYPRPQ